MFGKLQLVLVLIGHVRGERTSRGCVRVFHIITHATFVLFFPAVAASIAKGHEDDGVIFQLYTKSRAKFLVPTSRTPTSYGKTSMRGVSARTLYREIHQRLAHKVSPSYHLAVWF